MTAATDLVGLSPPRTTAEVPAGGVHVECVTAAARGVPLLSTPMPGDRPFRRSPPVAEPTVGVPTVILVDAETVSRQGLPLLMPTLFFVGSYESTELLVAERPSADVVVLDVQLGGIGSRHVRQRLDAVRAVVEAGYRVCLYTGERGRHLLVGCLSAGASAIVHKSEPLEALAAAVHAVAADQITITQSLVGLAELAERRHALPSLTDRQRVILSARARGEKFESIAKRLFISKKVAEEHWGIVARKFAGFLRDHSPADLERLLGLEPGDFADWPSPELADRSNGIGSISGY